MACSESARHGKGKAARKGTAAGVSAAGAWVFLDREPLRGMDYAAADQPVVTRPIPSRSRSAKRQWRSPPSPPALYGNPVSGIASAFAGDRTQEPSAGTEEPRSPGFSQTAPSGHNSPRYYLAEYVPAERMSTT